MLVSLCRLWAVSDTVLINHKVKLNTRLNEIFQYTYATFTELWKQLWLTIEHEHHIFQQSTENLNVPKICQQKIPNLPST